MSERSSCMAISYRPYEPQQEMLLSATGAAGAPVLFFIPGGYWRLLSKDDSSSMAPTFTRAGAVVVALNYSLAPAVTLDRIVDQTRRALAWVHAHIARYGGDPGRIHVCGSSAGGHLAGMPDPHSPPLNSSHANISYAVLCFIT